MFVLDFFGFLLGITIVVFVARPIAHAVSDKLRARGRETGSETGMSLEDRVKCLESQIIDLRQQLGQVQETAEFMSKYIETTKKPAEIEQRKNL